VFVTEFLPPPHQVAQYIKFEMPVLQSFITKLMEEEDREVQKLRSRCSIGKVSAVATSTSPNSCVYGVSPMYYVLMSHSRSLALYLYLSLSLSLSLCV
jgi:hypothetical protein